MSGCTSLVDGFVEPLPQPRACLTTAADGAGLVPLAPNDRSTDAAPAAGVGLKAEHYRAVLETHPDIDFFEIHAENYMGAGGPPHRYLSAIRERYPLFMHGVGLSIGAAHPLDREHLQALRSLIRRYRPARFSEHLAWSTHRTGFLNDLLPLPYTEETLGQVAEHIEAVQDVLGLQMLLENPSTYLAFAENEYSETDFVAELVRRTGCGLLLDVNNVYVALRNDGRDPFAYIDAFPCRHVQEIHLAGHVRERDDDDHPLLIDTHDRPVDPAVWELYAHALGRTGMVPTLIEWDAQVPEWSVLATQARQAREVATAVRGASRLAGSLLA